MKRLYYISDKILGGSINPCLGGWEYREKSGYLVKEKHWVCYPKM